MPTGGESELLHVPADWSRQELQPTATRAVWSAERTRHYLDGTFTRATVWTNVRQVADENGRSQPDYIFRLSANRPPTPQGGTTVPEHTPAGWTRTEPLPTPTESVWRAERTRLFEADDSFASATVWTNVIRTAAAVSRDTDEIWIRASAMPAVPAGGTTQAAHTPSGWVRSEPTPTTQHDVWRVTRTRTYEAGAFIEASVWGSLTKTADGFCRWRWRRRSPSRARRASTRASRRRSPQSSRAGSTTRSPTSGS